MFFSAKVFFPLAFREFNPDIVFVGKEQPAFADVHIASGTWERSSFQVACFNNNDYKDARMRKKDFLDETIHSNRTILSVFEESKLDVFRALDSELRQWFSHNITCHANHVDRNNEKCKAKIAKRLGNRAQLAEELFKFNDRSI